MSAQRAKAPPKWFVNALEGAKRNGHAIAIIIPDSKPEPVWDSVQKMASYKGTRLTRHPKLKLAIEQLEEHPKSRLVRRRMILLGRDRIRTLKSYKSYGAQDEVSFAIEILHHTADLELQCALMAVPFLCARAEWVGAKPLENLVLLDATGKRVAGQGVDLCFPIDVLRGINGLLRREGRLDRIAKAQRTAGFRRLLSNLRSDDSSTVRETQGDLVKVFSDHAAAMVVAWRESQNANEKARLGLVIGRVFSTKHRFPAGAITGIKLGPPETIGRHIGRANRIMLRFRTDR